MDLFSNVLRQPFHNQNEIKRQMHACDIHVTSSIINQITWNS